MSEETPKQLTGKQLLFANYYIGEARQNATKAAILAGYSKKTAYSIGSENLRKPEISAYIEVRQKDLILSATTVLTRLTEIANGKVTDFLDADKKFDLEKAKNEGKDGNLKKLKIKRTIKEKKTEVRDDMRGFLADDEAEAIETESEIIYEEVEFELYSAHEALRDLGKHHKLFTENINHGGEIGLKHSIDEQTIKDINAAYDGFDSTD